MIYTELFETIKRKAQNGNPIDIDWIMATLDASDLPISRAVDFYLKYVTSDSGISRLTHYLFEGTLIQRNYCALYFERRNDWSLINEAYDRGCIDYEQAYAR